MTALFTSCRQLFMQSDPPRFLSLWFIGMKVETDISLYVFTRYMPLPLPIFLSLSIPTYYPAKSCTDYGFKKYIIPELI